MENSYLPLYINETEINNFEYDAHKEQLLFYVRGGMLEATIEMKQQQYSELSNKCGGDDTPEFWNELVKIFGEEHTKLNCPLGGDESNDCEDCPYNVDYHYDEKTGDCVHRDN